MTNAETLIASNYADIELYRDNAVCWTQLDYDYDVFDSIRETLPGTTFIEKLDNLSYNISGASVAGKNLTFRALSRELMLLRKDLFQSLRAACRTERVIRSYMDEI